MTQPPSPPLRLSVRSVAKQFELHNQGGRRIPVLDAASFDLHAGDCMALMGPSGSGKSTLMRMIYGNYGCDQGEILVNAQDGGTVGMVDLARAEPREVMAIRRHTIGYVSQFLRVIPRVPAIDVVAEPARRAGADRDAARNRAAALLTRLNLPETLWNLSPTTFSGGEQQRVNIARGFAYDYPVLLLDEPTASLDKANRAVVLDLIREARDRGAAILGIFHDGDARDQVCNRFFDVEKHREAA